MALQTLDFLSENTAAFLSFLLAVLCGAITYFSPDRLVWSLPVAVFYMVGTVIFFLLSIYFLIAERTDDHPGLY